MQPVHRIDHLGECLAWHSIAYVTHWRQIMAIESWKSPYIYSRCNLVDGSAVILFQVWHPTDAPPFFTLYTQTSGFVDDVSFAHLRRMSPIFRLPKPIKSVYLIFDSVMQQARTPKHRQAAAKPAACIGYSPQPLPTKQRRKGNGEEGKIGRKGRGREMQWRHGKKWGKNSRRICHTWHFRSFYSLHFLHLLNIHTPRIWQVIRTSTESATFKLHCFDLLLICYNTTSCINNPQQIEPMEFETKAYVP